MSKRAVIVIGILGVGVFAWWYLNNKKTVTVTSENTPIDSKPSAPATGSDKPAETPIVAEPVQTPPIMKPADIFTPPSQPKPTDVMQQMYDNSQKPLFSDAIFPIPAELTNKELANLQKYCKLPNGSTMIAAKSGGAKTQVNYNIDTKIGLSNMLYERAGYSGSRASYYGKLKEYFKC